MEWLEFEPRLVGLSVILLGQPEEQFFFFNLNLNPQICLSSEYSQETGIGNEGKFWGPYNDTAPFISSGLCGEGCTLPCCSCEVNVMVRVPLSMEGDQDSLVTWFTIVIHVSLSWENLQDSESRYLQENWDYIELVIKMKEMQKFKVKEEADRQRFSQWLYLEPCKLLAQK